MVGSSGALVAAIYDRYAQDKITVLENLTREKLLQLKKYSLKWKAFSRKSSGLDPLNSYLSIPILINSKDNISRYSKSNFGRKRRCVFVRFRNCWRNGPYGHYLHGKPKRQRLPYDAENQFVKYTDACVESS
jgi:mevalonate kinase